jgi:phage-related minor tail protein
MAELPHCADKLVLVTEMLQAAQEYLNVSRGMLNDEDRVMVRLAYEQILNLRNRVDRLSKKVDALEGDLRRRLKAMGDAEAPTKSKEAGGSAT